MTTSTRRTPWENNRQPGGPDSLSVLFNWLKGGNHYARWRGGQNKTLFYWDLLAEFTKHGIHHHTRSDANVMLSYLQMSYNAGSHFLTKNGDPLASGNCSRDHPTIQGQLLAVVINYNVDCER
ncbi:hypothetical protein PGT21_036948 [Puccinia graminis f. sp. tritici]|uniref:Uncharacterized protein n=2 Tax=Puccinia graminis f. sp. tritici TaxID=56615 RepID=E3L377_PUCGT|nr:uncharacterized protein PGTG_17274 [Puccinia graminis f. sp. tritici CRL 75-36-700-3]EFP91002.2 hypothetical protein PGTG_17274 [Puccinia graminis f. sp. tritici CRL 75-36-700-3]KAA1120006.1 hypothetical protein PGT21_036948 [Puccinia graminis f. sp. tritici]